jgi:penicillin amidase
LHAVTAESTAGRPLPVTMTNASATPHPFPETRVRHALWLLPLICLTTAWGDVSALPTTRYSVGGLVEPVEILVDRWGVPHIYAPNAYSAFFGQGFNAARDRLWQIDLWRKRGLGELARDFGPAYAEQDHATRLFLYRGDMRAEWISYNSDTKRLVESFVAGVNAYVALVRKQPELLPPEFKLLGYAPAIWQAADIVRIRSHGLVGNLASEVARARVTAVADLPTDQFRRHLDPPWQPSIPVGLNPADVPEVVLRTYNLGHDPVAFTVEKLRGGQPTARDKRAELQHAPDQPLSGSNNFAVAPHRSTTGRPILASDPHRLHGVPSVRYFVHLSSPELDVVGAGEPFLPGVSLGHNGVIAVGITRFYIDQEDLYVYETNPAKPDEYRHRGRWEPFQVETETLEVKGEAARTVQLKFTRHGPVLFEDAAKHRAYAARLGPLEPGMAPYFPSIEYMRAKNWDEFLAALNRHAMPGLNFLYADRAGNIGWAPRGLAPVRPNWDGLLPVPGDGRYEWDGFRTGDELPQIYNPPSGWFGTANEMNIPADAKNVFHKLGFEWGDRARSIRLQQIFGGTNRLGIDDVIRAQTDVVNTTSQRIIPLLSGLSVPPNTPAAAALTALRAWDHHSHRDSVGAGVFNVWYHQHLRPELMRRLAPAAALPIVKEGDFTAARKYLENPDTRLGPDPVRARHELFLATLETAAAELIKRLGPDPAGWKWGRLHHALFVHQLAEAFPNSEHVRAFNVGPAAKSGDYESLGRGFWRRTDYSLTNGASARFVVDVGNWDNSVASNSPGQSGDPRSPHYRDLFDDWANDRYFPLLYSRAAIEKAAEARIVLTPAQ